MYLDKVSKSDFDKLAISVDHNRAVSIFNDMKEYVDCTLN